MSLLHRRAKLARAPAVPMYRRITYAQAVERSCVVCDRPLNPYPNRRAIPDYLDSECFRLYEGELKAPWLKYLMNQERSRRLKRQRYRRAGIHVEQVSFEALRDIDLGAASAP